MPYANQDGPSMESEKQEKYDLMHDNPVAKDASGGRPWISKHFKSSMSPLKDMHGSPAEKELVGNQKNLNPGLRAAIEAAPEDPIKMEEQYHYESDRHQARKRRKKALKKAAKGVSKASTKSIGNIGAKLAGEAGAKLVQKIQESKNQ